MYYNTANSGLIDKQMIKQVLTNVSLPSSPTNEQLAELGFLKVVRHTVTPNEYQYVVVSDLELVDGVPTITETLADTPIEVIAAKLKTQIEEAVQRHITSVCVERGYDNENSIAKYLVEGNRFYTEARALSLWIGEVWARLVEVSSELTVDSTPESVIALLPVFVLEEPVTTP